MVLPNIELYEALKKDLSEESARMIAEVVPQAGDLATKGDIARLKARVDRVESNLKSHVDSRLLRFTTAVVVPMMLGILGAIVAIVAQL